MHKETNVVTVGSQTWVKVADAGQTIYMQAQQGDQCYYAYGATAPTVPTSHVMYLNTPYSRPSITAALWVRSMNSTTVLAITKSGTAVGSGTRATARHTLHYTWTEIAPAGSQRRLARGQRLQYLKSRQILVTLNSIRSHEQPTL